MSLRFEIFPKENRLPGVDKKLEEDLIRFVDTHLKIVKTVDVFQIDGNLPSEGKAIAPLLKDLFSDSVLDDFRLNQPVFSELRFSHYIEVSYKKGVTDNKARVAQENLALGFGTPITETPICRCSKGYFIQTDLTHNALKDAFYRFHVNPTIQDVSIYPRNADPKCLSHGGDAENQLPQISTQFFENLTLETFSILSRERCLSLSLIEQKEILAYFNRPEVIQHRLNINILPSPTEVEIEALAQTWSEHCKHKIFNAKIQYRNEHGTIEIISSLFKTYIESPTKEIIKGHGDNSWCLSVFKDNAGVIRFNDKTSLVFKVETHNSPSAIDPYGGAMTGIVGVNRDAFGTGMGAEMLANTNVLCFGPLDYASPLPERILHPSRVFRGVRKGIEEGGNFSGIPTVNGSIIFDESYTGKPLVFCGTVSQMPTTHLGKPSEYKKVRKDDLIVMTGGRVGKDGIHGATFSSEILTESSPSSAVQIGDPITQKKMFDFLWEAKARGLYTCITDNGAGGLSSSVGELAIDTDGCEIDLHLVPLKYQGLAPWEILVSESQERMTLSVPETSIEAFLTLSEEMDVESTVIGKFNDSGYFKCIFEDECVALIEMDFLHKGVPQMELNAEWPGISSFQADPCPIPNPSLGELLLRLLGRPNICSRESVIRQYDHEVKGGSVIKPLTGKNNDGPNNSAVVKPDLSSQEGVVIGNGICPKYAPLDPYHMAACAIDEAMRNIIVVGAKPDHIAGLDNFCWPDPVESPTTPDGKYKLAQLVRACQGLKDTCISYGIPCISGKDSMKNDVYLNDQKISILPTLLFSVIGKIEDVRKAITSDFKKEGDLIYVLGETFNECGGSEYYAELGVKGGSVPTVKTESALERYRKLHLAIHQGWIASAHDCSDGGLGVTLAESCIGGELGVEVCLDEIVKRSNLNLAICLFSESQSRIVVSIDPQFKTQFEKLMQESVYFYIGKIVSEPIFRVLSQKGRVEISQSLDALKNRWQTPLKGV